MMVTHWDVKKIMAITTVKIHSGSICPARNKSIQTGDKPESEAEEEDVMLQSSARKVTNHDTE